MKHTKGPWKVQHSESKEAFNVIGTTLSQKYKIARCPYIVVENDPNLSKKEKEEAEANAKLIATAPNLLKALEGLVADIKRKPNDTRYATHIKIAEEAIKKATQ